MWLVCTLAACPLRTGARMPVRQRGPAWLLHFMWKVRFPSTWKKHQPFRVSSAPSYSSFTCPKKSFNGVKHSALSKALLIEIFTLLTAKPITIVQGLENVETFNGGDALFECGLSRPESKDCRWLLDGKPVKESPRTEIVSFENGRRHLLLLKELSLKDTCMVTFEAGTASTSAQLSVKGDASLQVSVVT